MLFGVWRDGRSTEGAGMSSRSERIELSMSSMSSAFRRREERVWSRVENC